MVEKVFDLIASLQAAVLLAKLTVFGAELAARSAREGWDLLDAWDLLPPQEFTNSAIHMNATAEQAFAQELADRLQPILCP